MKSRRKITVKDLVSLRRDERIRLMQELWDTLDEPDAAFELTEAQKAELDRRWKAYKRNPKRARSWDDVKADLLRDSRRTG